MTMGTNSVLTKCLHSARERIGWNGIYLFPVPTGAGKSFSAGEYIIDAWMKGERLWVTTANNANVSSMVDDAVKHAYELLDEADAKAFERQLIHLKSNDNIWRDHIGEIDEADIDYLGNAAKSSFGRMREIDRERKNYEKILAADKTPKSKDAKDSIDFMKETFSSNFTAAEKEFRKALKSNIAESLDRFKKSENLWAYIDEHPWIRKVYPYAEVQRTDENGRIPVVFCSVAKTGFPCDNLRGATEYLYIQISRLGGTVIIDEIDQSKEAYKGTILDDDPYNVYKVANRIKRGFTPENLADIIKYGEDEEQKENMTVFAQAMKDNGEELDASMNIGTLRRDFSEECGEKMNESLNYILEMAYRGLAGEEMYQSRTDTGAVLLGFEQTEGAINLRDVYRALRGYIKRWRAGSSYFLRALARKQGKPNPYDDSNIASYLKLIGFEHGTNEYKYASKLLKQKKHSLKYPVNTLYSHGMYLSIPHYDNDDTERNTILTTGVDTTPEEILYTIASSCLVIGLSATADNKTVLHNYNYDWIREQGITVETPNETEWGYVRERQEQRFEHIDDASYTACTVFDVIGELMEEDPSNAHRICEMIEKEVHLIEQAKESAFSHDYYFEQLKNITNAAICFAMEEGHKAGLIFTSRNYGRSIETICKKLSKRLGKDFAVLSAVGADLKQKTEKAHRCLAEGKRVLMACPFATAKQAWNFNYPKHAEDTDVIEISGSGDNFVDFDFMYIGSLAQILPTAENRGKNWAKLKIGQVYVVQDLYEAGEIDNRTRDIWITKNYMKGISISLKEQMLLQSYQYSILTTLIQTIGRLERARFKRQLTLVLFDPSYLQKTNADCVREYLDTHVLNPITECVLKAIANDAEAATRNASIEENIMSKMSSYTGRELHNQFGRRTALNPYREETMHLRRAMCEFTLRHPRPCESDFDTEDAISKQFFLKCGDPLYYKAEYDFKTIRIRKTPMLGYRLLCEEETLLPEMMRNEEVRSGFERYGYATSWGIGDFQMSPALMNNIYKGEIGERTVRILLENRGFQIEEIEDHIRYEECDFLSNGIAIDAKNMAPDAYTGSFAGYDTYEHYRDAAVGKMKRLGKDRFVFVNVFSNGQHKFDREFVGEGTIYKIPGLIDIRSGKIDEENMRLFLQVVRRLI